MSVQRIIEGTGEEIAEYAKGHPRERFQLILLSDSAGKSENWSGPDEKTWKEVLEFRRSLRGKMGALRLEATSTEALYD